MVCRRWNQSREIELTCTIFSKICTLQGYISGIEEGGSSTATGKPEPASSNPVNATPTMADQQEPQKTCTKLCNEAVQRLRLERAGLLLVL